MVEQSISANAERRAVVLVIEDEEETRYGIKRLLTASGYRADTAKNVEEAALRANLHRPDLILMSLSLDPVEALSAARRIRESAALNEDVPVVMFCASGLDEGAEVSVGFNIYKTWPDSFDQLRALISRLLRTPQARG